MSETTEKKIMSGFDKEKNSSILTHFRVVLERNFQKDLNQFPENEEKKEDSKIFLDFVNALIQLQGEGFKETECLNWANKCGQNFLQFIKENQLCAKKDYELSDFYLASFLAYIVHFSEIRTNGDSYLMHLEEALVIFLKSLFEEKKLREKTGLPNKQITSIQKVIRAGIKILLHDTKESIIGKILKKIDQPNGSQTDSINTMQIKLDFINSFNQTIELIFGKEIADSLTYVFTNFSERILTANSLREIKKGKINLSKEKVGRMDFIMRALSVDTKEDFRVTVSDKMQNAKDPQNMGKTKLLEFYNFAYVLLKIRNRASAKLFLKTCFDYYLKNREEGVKEKFEKLLNEKVKKDKACFEQYESILRGDLNNLYGDDNYTLEYKELDPLRVHELVMKRYFDGSPKKLQKKQSKDKMGHYLVSNQILEDPDFLKIFAETITGRAVVRIKDSFKDFHKTRGEGNPLQNFQQVARVDYFDREGNPKLGATGYQADAYLIKPKKETQDFFEEASIAVDLIAKRIPFSIAKIWSKTFVEIKKTLNKLNIKNHKNKNVEEEILSLKFVTETVNYRNEYGEKSFFDEMPDDGKFSERLANLRKDLKEMICEDNFRILTRISKEPNGVDLRKKVSEIDDFNDLSKEIQEKAIWEIFVKVSDKIKDDLFLNDLLASGCVQRVERRKKKIKRISNLKKLR